MKLKKTIYFVIFFFTLPLYAQRIDYNVQSLLQAKHKFSLESKNRFNLAYHITKSQEFLKVNSVNLSQFDKISLSVSKLLTKNSRCSKANGVSRSTFHELLKLSKDYLGLYENNLSYFLTDLEEHFSLWMDEHYCLKRLIIKNDEFYNELLKKHNPYLITSFQNILKEALSIQDIASSEYLELEVNSNFKTYFSYYKNELQKTVSIKRLTQHEKEEILSHITKVLSFFTNKAQTNKFVIDLSLALHSEKTNERYIFPILSLMERLSIRGITELNPILTSMIGTVNPDFAKKLSQEMNKPYQNLLNNNLVNGQPSIIKRLELFQTNLNATQNPFIRAFVLGAFERTTREISQEFDFSFRGNEAINRVMASTFRGNPYRALMGNDNSTLVGPSVNMGLEFLKHAPEFVAGFFEKTANYYSKRAENDFNTCRSNCGKETLSRTFSDMGTGFETAISTAGVIASSSGGMLALPGAAAASLAGFGHFTWDFVETLSKAKKCQASCNRFQQSASVDLDSNLETQNSTETQEESNNQTQAQNNESQNKGETKAEESRTIKETMNAIATEMDNYSIKEDKVPLSAEVPQADVKTEYEKKEDEKNCQAGSNCGKVAVGCVMPPGSIDPIIHFYTEDDMQKDILIKKGSLIIYIDDETRDNSSRYYRGDLSLSVLKLINFIDPLQNVRRSPYENNLGSLGGTIREPGWVDPPKPINFQ